MMAGELKRLEGALKFGSCVVFTGPVRVGDVNDLRTALDLLERAARIMEEVQRITGHDYGSVWLADYRKAEGE
jgi:hypothetical protein